MLSVGEILMERRILSSTSPNANGCWVWVGSVDPAGYGKVYIGERATMRYAHRVSYELFVGEIPPGLTVDHLCRNRSCVNPEHLEVVTLRENVLRGEGAGAINARKTHCKCGEPLSTLPRGVRYCRPCDRKYQRERYARQRGESC